MSKHLERAEEWCRTWVGDSAMPINALAALLAEVENEALERAIAEAEYWGNRETVDAIRALKSEPK